MADAAPAQRSGFRGGFGSRGSRPQVSCDFFFLNIHQIFNVKENTNRIVIGFFISPLGW